MLAKFVLMFFKLRYILILCSLIFLALLLRNPFSNRTLIPNFEPYPDTIHYINSAFSFIHGYGLNISREGRTITTNVPPLYSLIQIPLFLVHSDARMFYFTNVILSFVGFIFFALILKKLTKNVWILGLSAFLYVTNYFLYWYPTLAMADNLIIPLFLIGVYLLIIPTTRKLLIFAALFSWTFFLAKYASIVLSFSFIFLYVIKVFMSGSSQKTKQALLFISLVSIPPLIWLGFEQFVKGNNIIGSYLTTLNIFHHNSHAAMASTSNPWFSLRYLSTNLPLYIGSLIGKPARFLWDYTPIVPSYIAVPGILGLIWGITKSSSRFLAFSLLIMLFISILFMSTFYSVDMRYLYHAIPSLLIGFCLFCQFIYEYAKKNQLTKIVFYGTVALLSIFYIATNGMRIKSQIVINLKYAETPWYYISVLELNNYFSSAQKEGKKPVVISALIPYFVDFYSNKNYSLLPLDQLQDFHKTKVATWGPNDYSNLITLYKKYLSEGYPVYIHNYGLGNEKGKNNSYKKISDSFQLIKVHTGCLEACNIYRLELKTNTH